jgi:hypothetical protein
LLVSFDNRFRRLTKTKKTKPFEEKKKQQQHEILPGFCSVSQNESIQFVNVAISNIFDFCRQCVPSRTCVTSQDFDLIVESKLNT